MLTCSGWHLSREEQQQISSSKYDMNVESAVRIRAAVFVHHSKYIAGYSHRLYICTLLWMYITAEI
jgi:hypothetical protein